jgi:hypothetical protein
MNTIKKNTEALLYTSREVGLEINAKKIKYMFMSCRWNVGQNHNTKTGSKFFENVVKFKYLRTE